MTADSLRRCLAFSRNDTFIHSLGFMLKIHIIMLGFGRMLRKILSFTLSGSTIALSLMAWDRSFRGRRIQQWECRLKSLSPRKQRSIIETIHNGTLDMSQHLEIIIVLDITALQQSHAPIYHSELGMECSKDRSVEVDHLEIDIGNLTRCGEFDFLAGVLVLVNAESVFPCLLMYQPGLATTFVIRADVWDDT
jgi:hypothetical protein